MILYYLLTLLLLEFKSFINATNEGSVLVDNAPSYSNSQSQISQGHSNEYSKHLQITKCIVENYSPHRFCYEIQTISKAAKIKEIDEISSELSKANGININNFNVKNEYFEHFKFNTNAIKMDRSQIFEHFHWIFWKLVAANPSVKSITDHTNKIHELSHLASLNKREWLYDQIVDNYFELLVTKANQAGRKVHFFETFFFQLDDETVMKYLRKFHKDLFTNTLVFIPININQNHWILLIVDLTNHIFPITFKLYDSMSNGKIQQYPEVEKIKKFILKYAEEFGYTDINVRHQYISNPHQKNGYDCGVFISTYAFYLANDLHPDFEEKHMNFLREKMLYEIYHQELIYE